MAGLIGARSDEITFTSSGTEANAWALTGLAKARETQGRHLVICAVEHLSILQTARRMEKEGWRVTVVPVDRAGRVGAQSVEEAMTPETALVSIQWANGEVGTIQPMAEILRRVKAKGALLHSDAVAAAGQIPIDVGRIPVDALSLAANGFGGPPGVGALFVRKGVRIAPMFIGGTQEDGRRAGTENLIGIVGMGAAAAVAQKNLRDGQERLTTLRDRLIHGILERVSLTTLNGHPSDRLPGHSSFSFSGVDAETLLLALDLEGVAVGLGSACTSRTMKASHVLKAMGVPDSQALGTLSCTLGHRNTEEEIGQVLEILPRVVAAHRASRRDISHEELTHNR